MGEPCKLTVSYAPPPQDNVIDLKPVQKILDEQIERLKKELSEHIDKEIKRFHEGIKVNDEPK